jgi:polysaccharide deacetylase 2 family uncharacterized protein YibQ
VANKPKAAWAFVALALLGALAFWQYRRLKAVPSGPLPESGPARGAAETLEPALRALMPQAGLFREDWLSKDGKALSLDVLRNRDLKVLGEFFKSRLKPDSFEWLNDAKTKGFSLELGGEFLLATQDSAPVMALVIDDWGYHTRVLEAMKHFPGRLTIAVLPGLAHSRECAEAAFAAGHEVILHLPMEPEQKMPLTDGTLMVGMAPSDVGVWMDKHALSVPHMSGLNNHEGSKGSADAALMKSVCGWLSQHGGYFLDSKTSAKSLGEAEARSAGIPYAARRVFLDNVDQPGAIEKAAREALALAKKNGSCIAIGHPRENTLAVLARLAPEFEKAGVKLLRASDLTRFELKPDAR